MRMHADFLLVLLFIGTMAAFALTGGIKALIIT
jgi:hypothetical protein